MEKFVMINTSDELLMKILEKAHKAHITFWQNIVDEMKNTKSEYKFFSELKTKVWDFYGYDFIAELIFGDEFGIETKYKNGVFGFFINPYISCMNARCFACGIARKIYNERTNEFTFENKCDCCPINWEGKNCSDENGLYCQLEYYFNRNRKIVIEYAEAIRDIEWN